MIHCVPHGLNFKRQAKQYAGRGGGFKFLVVCSVDCPVCARFPILNADWTVYATSLASLFFVFVTVVMHDHRLFVDLCLKVNIATPNLINILERLAGVLHIQLYAFVAVHKV